MATIGRPTSLKDQAYGNVRMGKRNGTKDLTPNEIRERDLKKKQRLLNNLTGYKSTDRRYKDAEKHNKMGKDEFLKLMTVQLQNQDPSNPMDQGKMTGELAQFSQLEQLANLNKKFDTMNRNENVEDQFYGASFLGKEVVTGGRSVNFGGEGTKADILFSLEKPAEKVLVRVFDGKNNMVAEQWRENIGRGNQTFTWEGDSLDGGVAGAGEYSTTVYAWDHQAEPINVETKVTGTVESVFFENGETVLKVNGKKVFLRDVDSFHMPGTRVKSPITTGRPGGATNAANSPTTNLPIAQQLENAVKLKQMQANQGLNTYKNAEQPTTGLSHAYDVQ